MRAAKESLVYDDEGRVVRLYWNRIHQLGPAAVAEECDAWSDMQPGYVGGAFALNGQGMQVVLETLPLPAFIVDAVGMVLFMNRAAIAAAPFMDLSATSRLSIGDCLHEVPSSRLLAAVREVATSGAPASFVDRESRAASFTVCPVSVAADESASPAALLVIESEAFRPVKRREWHGEQRYRRLAELLPDAILVHSHGKVDYVNSAGARLWGAESPQVLRGMTYMDLIHPDDRRLVQDRVDKIHQGMTSSLREYRILRLDGSVVDIEATGTLINEHDGPAVLVMFRDISQRKRAEQAVRETMRRYQSLFEDSPIPLWEEDWSGVRGYLDELRAAGILDLPDHLRKNRQALEACFSLMRMIDANKACLEFYGADGKLELMTWMDSLLPVEGEIIRSALASLIEGHKTAVVEGTTQTLFGEERHVAYHFSLSSGCESTWAKVMISCIDFTSQKEAERGLVALNEKLRAEEGQRRALSQRLIEISENDRREVAMELHDHFGQLLTSLKLDLESVATIVGDEDTALAQRVAGATEKATQTMQDLKRLSSGLMPAMIENLGLLPALRALIDDMRGATHLDVRLFVGGEFERLQREKELALYRIAQEALNNVVKHADAHRVFVNLVRMDRAVSLSIEDDGQGFDSTQPDDTLWRGGPLGLHIMRERVAQFGGELTIDSRPSGGVHVLAEVPLDER